MTANGPGEEAAAGSMPRQVLIDLELMRDFLEARESALNALYGVPLRRSALRDELVRTCAIEFGNGRLRRVSYYQWHCRSFGSATATKREIRALTETGILVTRLDPDNARALLVLPTKRLVDFYSNVMTSLAEDVQELFIRRSGLSS